MTNTETVAQKNQNKNQNLLAGLEDNNKNLLAGLEDDWPSASKYLSMFIDEAQRTLDEITDALLALEAGGGRENVEQLFVAAHRLKGSAASIGLNRAAKLAHMTEDLLQDVVDRGGGLDPEIGDAVLMFADGLRKYVDALKQGRPREDQFDALARGLLAAHDPTVPPDRSPGASAIPSDLHQRVAAAVCDDQRDMVLVGTVVFQPGLPLVGLKARLLYEKLSNLGEIRYFDPPAEDVENREEIDVVAFGLFTERSPAAVRRLVRIAGIQRMTVEPLAATAAPAQNHGKMPAVGFKPAETMRVEVKRLDQLMNLAGQLAIGQSRMARIGQGLKQAVAGRKPVEDLVNDLFEGIRLLDRVGDGIQQAAMNMRMAPIGPLLRRFQRVVRDITRANGKDIRLVISGEQTELDKRMIDELGDPLVHMIRNAADHGIESPDDRRAAGKPPQGTITLEAFHRGGNIVIRVSDDGRGLDAERIRRRAVEKGICSAADAQCLTAKQLYPLVWSPGLSTAEKVSEVSGRGMGMDIVRLRIEKLNGAVELESQPGQGTTVTVKLPLTLAILPSLMAEIDGQVFAVPMESVAEIVEVGRRDVTTVRGHQTALVGQRVVPVVTLDTVFGGRRDGRPTGDGASAGTTLVILGRQDQQIGLAVDCVLGEEDVVVKSIAANYRHVAGVAGASVLSDGRVSLILDPPALMEMSVHVTTTPIANVV